MIMTHTEEATTTYEPKTPTNQMNGHTLANSGSQESEDPSSTTTSPSEGRHASGSSGSSVLEMGSTDSAGSAHGSGPSCGLVSSLFPSSCRGRAEAFARRLHRRLTSLGSEDNSPKNSDTNPKETSWLCPSSTTSKSLTNNATTNHVLQHQPRHSPKTDLCFDFDLDIEDGLSSPAEEATAAELADLLVNPEVLKMNHRDRNCTTNGPKAIHSNVDLESGCVFASPITGTSPDSDSSELYFDPETSDVEKKNEVYFDPVTTSDSEVTTSNLSNGCETTKGKGLVYRRRPEVSAADQHSEDTSESSSSLQRNNVQELRNNEVLPNSEDSIERSSLETTSPSHESLWSTFDESTMSLQDETPSKILSTPSVPQNRLPKSHSDSEIPVHAPRILISRNDEETQLGVDQVDFVNGISENGKLEDIKNARNLIKDESPDSSENTNEDDLPYDEESPKAGPPELCALKVEEAAGNEQGDHSTYSSMINIPGALTLECSSGERVVETLKNEVQLQIEDGNVTNKSDEDKMCILLQKLTTSPAVRVDIPVPNQEVEESIQEEEEEEEEGEEGEEEERPQKIRRCSSLKTGKTPPGTPGRKKIVRFADVLGLDLADVRTFLDEIPKVPNSAYSDLIYNDIFQKDTSPVNTVSNTWENGYSDTRRSSGCVLPGRKLDRTLVPLFQQPGGMSNFLDLVRERKVCLENALVQDPISLSIQGTVRVINLDFHKSVHIRYTLNSWRNYSDLQATYVPNSCDGFSDTFSFVLYCHTLSVGQRLEFAVRFQCKGEQYWDNNAGINYCFQCLKTSSPIGYMPITASENREHEWSPVFY
nr:glycogen-binding subunit 76A isoform X1 [Megalopta genalis]